ncbi:uncharacterized protein [Littorina saxatilis]|uniref:uncharacterized protein n=1 Tax=Littorina saxatilis TaxID=31220 RepID=UPI0038B698E2
MPSTCCCVYGCSNRSGHLFPKDPNRRKQWETAVKREEEKKNWKATNCSIVCKEHFLPSDYHASDFGTDGLPRKQKYLKKTAVPSIFHWTKIRTPAQNNREERLSKRRKLQTAKKAAEWESLHAEENESYEPDIIIQDEEFIIEAEVEIDSTEVNASDTVESNPAPCSSTDSYFFPTSSTTTSHEFGPQVETVQACQGTKGINSVQQPYLCIDSIKHSDKFVHHYTGLESYSIFQHALWSLGENINCLKYAYSKSCACLSVENQFLLMLVKLRQHYPHIELARMFGVSEFTVQNVFVTWVNFCYLQWGEINWWPDRHLVTHFCPTDFKLKFPTTRVIVDATEVRVKQPSNPRAQKASFSTYKHGNTVKVLVGVTPSGLTSYVSDAYGGSTSDRQIVERSPLPLLCESGDSIMADKGFNVQDIFAPRNVLINIPAFFKKKNRLGVATLQKDRKIASKRVHVERIIGMAKVYTICQHKLNLLETRLASRIITVCFYLCNFRKTVVSRFA